eukprot:TRINITY_DN41357_c0_g1_i1.p1 TRINITY_DN41357_c0_g1~~TRINITY_DN41357_c0_g1_i1.p1  ORF type:complete len:177 (+),score=29.06 TRINITY_DN41357_c0_g1_i1:70-531(+)
MGLRSCSAPLHSLLEQALAIDDPAVAGSLAGAASSRSPKFMSFFADPGTAACHRGGGRGASSGQRALSSFQAPTNGTCYNEEVDGDNASVGNHCVLLTGSKLDDFQTKTNQDFSTNGVKPSAWCVCLHLYKSWGQGGGDTTNCSAEAMQDAGL